MLNTRGSHWSGAEYATGNWSEGRGARRDLQGHRTFDCVRGLEKIYFVSAQGLIIILHSSVSLVVMSSDSAKVPFLAQDPESGEASYGSIQREEFRAVSFHDVEYTIPGSCRKKTKKILHGIR